MVSDFWLYGGAAAGAGAWEGARPRWIVDGGAIWLNHGSPVVSDLWLYGRAAVRSAWVEARTVDGGTVWLGAAGQHDEGIRAALEPQWQRLPRRRLRSRIGRKARRGKDHQ